MSETKENTAQPLNPAVDNETTTPVDATPVETASSTPAKPVSYDDATRTS